ncbi:MAG: dihydroorotate dehydrogenase-like protein [Spirochaetaceae bacterium]|nr:MAG: dihydroorotate dehydrogenase-like protein [Spirochaetaceae bacterium]
MTPNIGTSYMGLDLVSPVIAASSGITDNVDSLKQLEQCGAGAVVLKSLFEEEIIAEMQRTQTQMLRPGFTFPDMADMFDYVDGETGVANYLELIRRAKSSVTLPVIASVNCISAQKWTYFAREIQDQGADGLELNIFVMPSDFEATDAATIERTYFEIIAMVLDQVSIPVAVKLSHYFTLLGRTLQALSESGIKAMVLFNRFFSPDFDLHDLSIVPTNVFSTPAEFALPLRWIAIMSGRVGCDLAASTGVHDGDGVIKQILAGADAVQVASVLYRHGVETVQHINERLRGWMSEQGYDSLQDFRGALSQVNVRNPAAYDRVQFVKNFRAMQ